MSECWDTTRFVVADRLSISISDSAAKQLFVYAKNSSRKRYVNHSTMAWLDAKLGRTFTCTQSEVHVCWGRQNVGCVALAVSISKFHLSHRLICCTDWTVMLISSLLWDIYSSLDSGLLATAIKVSISCHNSAIKLLIQNSLILFHHDIVLSLHCTFQPLNFQWLRRKLEQLSHGMTNTHDSNLMPLGLWPPRHNQCS